MNFKKADQTYQELKNILEDLKKERDHLESITEPGDSKYNAIRSQARSHARAVEKLDELKSEIRKAGEI